MPPYDKKHRLSTELNAEQEIAGFTQKPKMQAIETNYLGQKVFGIAGPLMFGPHAYQLHVEIPRKIALKGVNGLARSQTVLLLLCIVVMILYGYTFGRKIGNPIEKTSSRLHTSNLTIQKLRGLFKKESTTLLKMAGDQKASMGRTSQLVAENVVQAKENLAQAEMGTQTAEKVDRAAAENVISIQNVVESMKSIEAQMQNIDQIQNMIQSIKAESEAIDEIVFQTKILSFNASVEAERAGEAGRGFSVVAEEVGQLATDSQTAAKKIRGEISTAITQTNKIKEKVYSQVVNVSEQMDSSRKQVQAISSQVKRLGEGSRSLKEKSATQVDSLEKVLSETRKTLEISTETAVESNNLHAYSEELGTECSELSGYVEELQKLVENQ